MFTIIDKNKQLYCGGAQAWLSRPTAVEGGCGATAAANLLVELGLRDAAIAAALPAGLLPGKDPSADIPFKEANASIPGSGRSREDNSVQKDDHNYIAQTDYAAFLNSVYQTVGSWEIPFIRRFHDRRPGCLPSFIRPSGGIGIARFTRRTMRYALSRGIYLRKHTLVTTRCSAEKALAFIRQGLKESGAIALLLSWNTVDAKLLKNGRTTADVAESAAGLQNAKSITLHNHFITLYDIRQSPGNDYQLYASTWGQTAVLSFRDLVRSWQSLKATDTGMIYFTSTENEKQTRREIRTCPLLLLHSIASALLGRLIRICVQR